MILFVIMLLKLKTKKKKNSRSLGGIIIYARICIVGTWHIYYVHTHIGSRWSTSIDQFEDQSVVDIFPLNLKALTFQNYIPRSLLSPHAVLVAETVKVSLPQVINSLPKIYQYSLYTMQILLECIFYIRLLINFHVTVSGKDECFCVFRHESIM